MYKALFFLSFSLFIGTHAGAADLLREQRIAEQIQEAILDGEPLLLKDGAHEFLAIYTRTTAKTVHGAVLLLHGRGANPDWTDVIQPLRVQLPEHGWDTLSIQLPVGAESDDDAEWLALVPEAAPRIDAALVELRGHDIAQVVIVAHSFGARMAAHYLARQTPPEVRAAVLIGLTAEMGSRDAGPLGDLRQIKLPLLDLYGERDLAGVMASARERQLAAKDAQNSGYEQVQVAGADHFFTGQNATLVARVRAWLAKIVVGDEIK